MQQSLRVFYNKESGRSLVGHDKKSFEVLAVGLGLFFGAGFFGSSGAGS